MGSADADVVEAAVDAQGDLAVAGRCGRAGRGRGGRVVWRGWPWGGPGRPPPGLARPGRDRWGRCWLETATNWSNSCSGLDQVGGWWGWAASHCFWGSAGTVRPCREVVGLVGRLLFCSTWRRRSSASRALRPGAAAGNARGEDHRVVGQRRGRSAEAGHRAPGSGRARPGRSRPWWAVTSRASRRWSPGQVEDLGVTGGCVVGPASGSWAGVRLPALVRQRCLEPLVGGLGALGGLWVTSPSRVR